MPDVPSWLSTDGRVLCQRMWVTGTQQVPGPVTACRAQHVRRAQPCQALPSDCALFTSDLGMIEHCWLLSLSLLLLPAVFPSSLQLSSPQPQQTSTALVLHLPYPPEPTQLQLGQDFNPTNQLMTPPACVNLTLLKCCLLYQKPTQTWDNDPKNKWQFLPEEESSFSCYLLH